MSEKTFLKKVMTIYKSTSSRRRVIVQEMKDLREETKKELEKLERKRLAVDDDVKLEILELIVEFEKTFRFDDESKVIMNKFIRDNNRRDKMLTIASPSGQFSVVWKDDRWMLDFAWSASKCERTVYSGPYSYTLNECLEAVKDDITVLNEFLSADAEGKYDMLE